MNIKKLAPGSNGRHVRRSALAVAIAMGFGLSGQVFAQSTSGTIFGQVPAASGESVQIVGGSGYNRTVPLDQSGRYSVTVPVGTYSVTLLRDGQAVQTHSNITPNAGGAQEADFVSAGASANSANTQTLSGVTVTANALPAIDVTSTTENTTITAEQLKHLPLQRSAAAIALLAPGTTQGASLLGASGRFGGGGPTGESVVSFGGSSVVENAYYINGFNTSDPLSNTGGITLPYGAIDQQQTLTSGYGAQYGRSAGGVISQVGKSGTNTWQFGGQVLWQPAFAQGDYGNWHYANPRSTTQNQQKGDIYDYRNPDSQWNTVYDAYVGGPLIKDKLFFFIAAEASKTQTDSVSSNASNNYTQAKSSNPKIYAKLDWNINDSNTLSLTGIKNSVTTSGPVYDYDYDTHQSGAFKSNNQELKNAFSIYVAKYTSYITDDLTLNAMYGKMKGTYYSYQPPYPGSELPHIYSAGSQNPALNGGNPLSNPNLSGTIANADHKSTTSNLRLDLDWKLGSHDIQFGIDNDNTADINDGNSMTGPGYAWEYGQAAHADQPIEGEPGGTPYVGPTNANPGAGAAQGYYVDKYVFVTQATVQVKQRAQYIQDNWQVNDRLLLDIGLRNDQFTNYNPEGQPYARLTSPQWAPRLGFSWDVLGDSSLKIFGNAGRYYLAMPAALALRSAGDPLFTRQYYTYTGIDPNGLPTGVTPIDSNPEGAVPVNGENGKSLDPRTVASKNLGAEYQDEFVLGMQQQLSPSWVYGVTGTVRKLKRVVDDVGDVKTIYNAMIAQGADPTKLTIDDIPGSILINPGSSNVIRAIDNTGAINSAVLTPQDFGFPPVKRNYASLEMYLEHPWDGKWTGKIDYVFSRSYGNTEGPVQSNIGQGQSSVSATEQWDYGPLMQYANGDQANEQKHVLKAYGTYQIAPEWTVSGILTVASGTPESCLGFFGPGELDPVGYGGSYHWCGGNPAAPGKTGFTPWTHILSLNAEYRPEWADKKLGFQVQVYNVFNEQKVTQVGASYGSTDNPNPQYLLPQGMETPRYVQVGVTYDW
jgi:outer membrane receptor protein involved in Fe transport